MMEMQNTFNQPSGKVFCLGLSKTGTSSWSEAMSILGYNSVHYFSPELYVRDMVKGQINWQQLMKTVDAASDIPIPYFYRDLDESFPNSKFVLLLRNDEEKWLESCRHQMDEVVAQMTYKFSKIDSFNTKMDNNSLIRFFMYGCINFNRERYRHVYEKHKDEVINFFRTKNRMQSLLIMDITAGDGWNELCNFLGKPIPNQPFPHLGQRQ